MMSPKVILLFGGLLLSLPDLSDQRQPKCAQPGVAMATNGADLKICSADQRCLDSYITSMKEVAENILNEGLTLELNETSYMFSRTVKFIENYFNTTFRERWIHFFPNPGGLIRNDQLPEIYDSLVNEFLNNLTISDTTRNFNTSTFVNQSIVEALATAAANLHNQGNDTIGTCILQQLESSVNATVYSVMARQLETIRRGLTSLRNFEHFLRNYSQNTRFKFPSDCVNQFVNIGFCDRCNEEVIPPLCSNTCGALIRGCYSPYYEALPKQFNILWNVSQQVLDVVNSSLRGLFAEGQRLFNETMVEQLRNPQTCGITIQFFQNDMSSNITPFLIRGERTQELRDMMERGLSYGERGPIICQPIPDDEQQFCTNSPPTARQRYCNSSAFCTSTCNCYDGEMNRDTDTQPFKLNNTKDQKMNPVICLNCTELKVLRNDTNPVVDFLMRDTIRDAIPEGVRIQFQNNFTNYPCDNSGFMRKSMMPVYILASLGLLIALLFLQN